MATKKKESLFTDPAEAANRKILAQRQKRILDKEAADSMDLGLKIEEKEPEDAAELLRDEFDKKAFGDAPKTTTRIVYGPDPCVDNCPEFHDRLEKWGKKEVAEAFRKLILAKGELAAPDAIMRKAIKRSITRFGAEATAQAFHDRVMSIPERTVEIEMTDAIDPLIVNPMREIVAKYAPPGFAVKFLSDRCMDVLGRRGYEIVKDERGDVVKCGTLIMGIIPKLIAERRQQHFAQEAIDAVREQEEAYYEAAARQVRSEGVKGLGAKALERGESVRGDASESADFIGEIRETGYQVGGRDYE